MMEKTLNGKPMLVVIPALTGLAFGTVLADEPDVDIVSPTTGDTIFCEAFPCPTPVSIDIEIHHTNLKDLNVFKVEVNGASILHDGTESKDEVGSPFLNAPPGSANTCSGGLIAVTTACSTNGPEPGDFAELSVPWVPAGVGSYTIVASVKHTNDIGEDEETVMVAMLSAEYPAPPAEANWFLDGNYTKRELSGRVRGCIIQQIAHKHAAGEYGPRGGPYSIPDIHVDAAAFYDACK
jgi:hypothetical protein